MPSYSFGRADDENEREGKNECGAGARSAPGCGVEEGKEEREVAWGVSKACHVDGRKRGSHAWTATANEGRCLRTPRKKERDILVTTGYIKCSLSGRRYYRKCSLPTS